MTDRPRTYQSIRSAEPLPDERILAELNRVRSAFVGALSREELLVGAFLSQMGPAVPPAGLIESTCQRLRDAAQVTGSVSEAPGAVWRVAESMGWALRGPVLALNTAWTPYGARQMVQYTWGLLPLPAPERPRQQGRGWLSLSGLWRTGRRGWGWVDRLRGRRGTK